MALTLLSPVSDIYRRDVEVDDSTLVDPTETDCLVAGEWVVLSASGQADIGARADAMCYQVFTEKGDYSAQALEKVTILSSFDYIATTDQFTDSGTACTTGTLLKVNGDGVLTTHGLTTGDIIVAVCLEAASGGVIKFQRVSPYTHN